MAQIARENPGNPERWMQGGYGGPGTGHSLRGVCMRSIYDEHGKWLDYCRLPEGHLYSINIETGEKNPKPCPCQVPTYPITE